MMVARGNLWQRDYDILAQAAYDKNHMPKIQSTSRTPDHNKIAACQGALQKRISDETHLKDEIQTAVLKALHDNYGYVKLNWDPFRMVPSFIACDGDVIYDSVRNHKLYKARWCAEIVERPITDVLADDTFSKEVRNKLEMHVRAKIRPEDRTPDDLNRDIKLYYIWSKLGETPWEKYGGRKHIVVCDDWREEPLLVEDWTWDFLDHDQFPIFQLEIKVVEGQDYATNIFMLISCLIEHYNWAASFALDSSRREIQKKIFYNKNKFTDTQERAKLTSNNHLEMIGVDGAPEDAVHVGDFSGNGATVAQEQLALVKGLHDEQSGINNIARGQSPGGRTTAEEVRTLDQKSDVIFGEVSKAVDEFVANVIRVHTFACIRFIPQWSRIVNTDGSVVIRSYEGGFEQYFPLTDPGELAGLPTTDAYEAGHIIRPGVDAWVGVEKAIYWADYDLDQLQRDFLVKVESVSARGEAQAEEKRDSMAMLQTLGPQYMQIGAVEPLYELYRKFVKSFGVDDVDLFLPSPEMLQKLLPQLDPQLMEQGGAQPLQQMGGQYNELGAQTDGAPDSIGGNATSNVPDGNPANALQGGGTAAFGTGGGF